MAAVIDAKDLERLTRVAEDLADIEAADAARAEIAERGTVPWGEVGADLELDWPLRIKPSSAAARMLRKMDGRAQCALLTRNGDSRAGISAVPRERWARSGGGAHGGAPPCVVLGLPTSSRRSWLVLGW